MKQLFFQFLFFSCIFSSSFQRLFDFSAIGDEESKERILAQEREHQVLKTLHSVSYLVSKHDFIPQIKLFPFFSFPFSSILSFFLLYFPILYLIFHSFILLIITFFMIVIFISDTTTVYL